MFINFLHQPHRRWVFGQVTPTLETAWMFETDFARPRRKMAVGRSISSEKSEKSWLFCQMRPVKTACQVMPSCSLLPRLQIDMARSQNWFRNWFKMANGKTEYQRISTSVSWSWCVFSFDWKPCHLYYALIQLDPKTKGGLKVKVTKLEPHLSHICFLSKRCQMLHVPYGGPCSPPPLSWYWHLPAGAFERGTGIPVWKCPKCHVLQSSTLRRRVHQSTLFQLSIPSLDWASGRNVMSQGCSQRPNLLDSRQHRQPDWRL